VLGTLHRCCWCTWLQDGVDIVIASGGDGTINAVAGALLNSKVALGIIPRQARAA
jgi:diacylglycerol kinase family enzyme